MERRGAGDQDGFQEGDLQGFGLQKVSHTLLYLSRRLTALQARTSLSREARRYGGRPTAPLLTADAMVARQLHLVRGV